MINPEPGWNSMPRDPGNRQTPHGGGRRAGSLAPQDRRSVKMTFALTPRENAALVMAAQVYGTPMQDLLRERALNDIVAESERLLAALPRAATG